MPSDPSTPYGETTVPVSIPPVRHHRLELREAMTGVELAIASPVPGRPTAWAEVVGTALSRLAADFDAHVAVTEAPGGLHSEIVAQSPRLSGPVARLAAEHAEITQEIEALRARLAAPLDEDGDARAVREQATELLARLARHRQRGADLIWEAFTVDIGGET